MLPTYDVATIRTAENQLLASTPDGALMAKAAHGLAVATVRWLASRGETVRGAELVILAGTGNNGGDALYAAAKLAQRGARITVVMLADSAHAGGLAAVVKQGGRVLSALDVHDLKQAMTCTAAATVVLDGIVGLGATGALRPDAADLARAARGRLIAVDSPSGLNPSTGAVLDPYAVVAAELTVTFGAMKSGLVLPPGCWYVGDVQLVDIGLTPILPVATPVQVMDEATARSVLARPGRGDNKYSRGVLGVVAGSNQYPGAGILCTGASRYGGVGMVRYAGGAREQVVNRWPDVVPAKDVVTAGQAQAWVVGPGGGTDDTARTQLLAALATEVPVVVDADALTLAATDTAVAEAIRSRNAVTVLTPHTGEFARLGGDADAAELGPAVIALAQHYQAVVLLKGAATVIATPNGEIVVSHNGPPELATAGSGDVLAGVLGSLLASQLTGMQLRHTDVARARWQAAVLAGVAAYLHGRAAHMASAGGRPIVSDDVLAALPKAIAQIRQSDIPVPRAQLRWRP